MPEPRGRAHLRVENDSRLLAGLAGAVEHFAHKTEFSAAATADLIAAVEEACRETFPLLTAAQPSLTLVLTAYADHVEIVIEHRGEALPSAGLDTFLGDPSAPGGLTGLSILSKVDRVQYNTEGGVSRTTLSKHRPSAAK
jgi:hypothetical protein